MAEPTLLKTPLFDWHQSHGGRLVEFGGWSMPVQYTTIVDEHQAVRQRVGLFDISHMGRLTFDGPGVLAWLERVTTNHVAKLNLDQIQYSLMANDQGGLIDDILVYRHPYGYYLVCNASNRPAVLAQLEQHRQGAVGNFHDRTLDTAMIAVQGPEALETLQPLFDQPLEPVQYYHLTMGRLLGDVNAVVSRTGYTGEDGFELIVAAKAGRARLERPPRLGPEPRHPAVRAGSARHAAVRGGDAALRPRAVRGDQPVRGRCGLGRQARQGRFRRSRMRCAAGSGTRAGRGSACGSKANESPARERPCSTATARSARSPRVPSRRPCKAAWRWLSSNRQSLGAGTPLTLDVRGHREPRRGRRRSCRFTNAVRTTRPART